MEADCRAKAASLRHVLLEREREKKIKKNKKVGHIGTTAAKGLSKVNGMGRCAAECLYSVPFRFAVRLEALILTLHRALPDCLINLLTIKQA
jgi:hypothetical protein